MACHSTVYAVIISIASFHLPRSWYFWAPLWSLCLAASYSNYAYVIPLCIDLSLSLRHSARTSRKTVKLALAFSTSIILYLVVAVSGFLGLVADYQNAAAINTEEYAVAANVLRVCTAITLAAWIGTVIFAVLTMKNLVDTLRKSQAFYDERSRTSFDGKAVGEYRDGKDCESGYSDDSLIEFNEKI